MSNDPFFTDQGAAEEIERCRCLFEKNWKEPSVQRIRKEVETLPAEWRNKFLRELLFIEFEFARRKAMELQISAYTEEFPEQETIILEVMEAVAGYTVFHPQTVGAYTLLEKLGHGGMGIVYRAKHNYLDKQVAIKFIKKDYIHNEEAVRRFLTEMKSLGLLSHPNIVMATDAGISEDGTPYLVMELIEGCNLTQWRQQNTPKESVFSSLIPACEIIRNAAWGLQAIHKAGLVHRDIKPENLIVQTDGMVKILDLGLAKLCQRFVEGAENQTRHGLLLGSLGYMAPEQLYAPSQVDTRADIYSLGGTLFYLLFGRSPAEKQREEQPCTIPKKVRTILDRALAADPAVRYQEPGELAQDLDAFLAQNQKKRRHSFLLWTGSLSTFVVVLSSFAFFRPSTSHETEIHVPQQRQRNIAPESPSVVPTENVFATIKNAAEPVIEPAAKALPEYKNIPELETALELRNDGEIEQARVLLLNFEKQLHGEQTLQVGDDSDKTTETPSARILPHIWSALGDCDFFSGIASGASRSRKIDRVIKWYEEALQLSDHPDHAIPESFKAELVCKLMILDAIRSDGKQEQSQNQFVVTKRPFAESWTQIQNRYLQLFHQLAEAITVFKDNDKPLRNFVEQFEWSEEPELFTHPSRELRLFALEFLIAHDFQQNNGKILEEDLRSLDRILFSSYFGQGNRVYLRRYFDLAISLCSPDDYSQLVRYLLRLRPQNPIGFRNVIPDGATIVLFYFSPTKDVNGFAIYYPQDRQQTQRFDLPNNRNEIKDAIEHDISLPLDENLVALIRKDYAQGIPIFLSWDDSSCWPSLPLRDAFRNEDWPFEDSLALEEILGQLK